MSCSIVCRTFHFVTVKDYGLEIFQQEGQASVFCPGEIFRTGIIVMIYVWVSMEANAS